MSSTPVLAKKKQSSVSGSRPARRRARRSPAGADYLFSLLPLNICLRTEQKTNQSLHTYGISSHPAKALAADGSRRRPAQGLHLGGQEQEAKTLSC